MERNNEKIDQLVTTVMSNMSYTDMVNYTASALRKEYSDNVDSFDHDWKMFMEIQETLEDDDD